MRKIRIYEDTDIIANNTIELGESASNHVARVLRMQCGEAIYVFNGTGIEAECIITQINKKSVICNVKSIEEVKNESPLNIHLGQVLNKGDKMDLIVQKCVELGVTEITPLVSQRCNIKLTEDRLLKKQQTLQKIVISACEQCGRAIVPKINPNIDIVDFVKEGADELKLTLNPYAKFKIKELDVKTKNIRLLVGPEGGFNETETKMAADNNYTDVLLGPRILRTETAALVAISIIQSQFGDI